MIRVGVVGATGRMGREVCRAVAADPDLILVAAVSRSAPGRTLAEAMGLDGAEGGVVLADRLDALVDAGADVLVDFTLAAFAAEHVAWAIEHGIHVVVGTTGFEVDDAWRDAGVGVVDRAELRDRRRAADAVRGAGGASPAVRRGDRAPPRPEGRRAQRHGACSRRDGSLPRAARRRRRPPATSAHPGARGADVDGVRVHSVRLPGLVAHEEVLFGGQGQTLTIRHDSTDRTSFMPGVLLAIKTVGGRPGLTVGIDELL